MECKKYSAGLVFQSFWFLEFKKAVKMRQEAKRYEVKNGNEPTIGNITEEKECEMEEFIDYAKVIMGTLGHKVFESIRKSVDKPQEDAETKQEDRVIL